MKQRGSKKTRVGTVVAKKMAKTITVLVERRVAHPEFKKFVNRRKKYLVHDEKNQAGLGDKVEIVETRPISKLKHWALKRIVVKSVEVGL